MISDVLVVGAGIFGVSAALELRRRGAEVTVVDPGPIPHQDASSTDISKLIRLDYGADAFYVERMEVALERWRAMNDRFERPLFHETGLLVLSSAPMDAASFEGASFACLGERGHRLERLDAAAIADRAPAWRRGKFVDGYFNPQGGWAESGAVVRALTLEAERAGVTVRAGVRIRPIDGSGAVTSVRTEAGETLSASSIVIAAGAFTPVLVPELADRLTPIAQDVFHFAPGGPADYAELRFLPWAADIARAGWYGFPLHEGVVKIANHGPGRRVDPSAPRAVPSEREANFRNFLKESLPGLVAAPVVRTRVCLYCDAFDGDFLIDRHPARPGLVVAAGGSGHAFKFAPILGEVIADAVVGARREERLRFAWRERTSGRLEAARSKT